MKRGSLWLLIGLTVAGLIAVAVLVWSFVLRPPLQVSDLQPGQRVSLRSGLTLTLPPGSIGSLSRWRSADVQLSNPTGLADSLVLSLPGPGGSRDAAASVFWQADKAGPLALLERAHLLSRSADGSVEVRWTKPSPGLYNVFVITRLPGGRPGVLQISAGEARDAATVWSAASAAWHRLNITDVELPAPAL